MNTKENVCKIEKRNDKFWMSYGQLTKDGLDRTEQSKQQSNDILVKELFCLEK